jgi:hypothetical protein
MWLVGVVCSAENSEFHQLLTQRELEKVIRVCNVVMGPRPNSRIKLPPPSLRLPGLVLFTDPLLRQSDQFPPGSC